jgi:cell division transport system permease protein
MQMVGATKQFIRKPFILKSVKLGLIGALLAMTGMAILLFYLNRSFPELQLLQDTLLLAFLFGFIFLWVFLLPGLAHFLQHNDFLIYAQTNSITKKSPLNYQKDFNKDEMNR